MSWRDGRDSCTCSCTLTGLPAQIPTELRRGSANKTQTVILEVPTCLTPHILTIPPLLYYCYYITIATLHYVACFNPSRGSLGRILLYIFKHKQTRTFTRAHIHTFCHTHIYIYIYYCILYIYLQKHICILLYRINACECVLCMRTCGHAHARSPYTYINYVNNFGERWPSCIFTGT